MSDYELDLDKILAEFNEDAAAEAPIEERRESVGLSRRERREAAERAAAAEEPVYDEPEELPEEDVTEDDNEEPVRSRKKKGKKARKVERYEDDDYEAYEDGEPRKRRDPDRRRPLLVLLCWLLFLGCLAFSALNLHPTISTSSGRTAQSATARPVEATPVPVEPTPEALQPVATLPPETQNAVQPEVTPVPTPEPTPEPIHYSIPEGALVAPAPRLEGYGSVSNDNAAEMLNVIQRARDSGLLPEDEQTVFERNLASGTHSLYRGGHAKDILYYLDDTILTILWKEEIEGNSVTFTEVKIADGSQLRRKFTEDTFGSYNSDYASQLAAATNAVVAMNADFYLFRDFGMVAYNRELFRFNTGSYDGNYSKYNCVDTLFVTAGGDFLYKRLGEQNTWDSIQQFIDDNDVVFSVAFGPVLVENGQAVPCDWYPVGEVGLGYSRAGIGQMGPLHYLYMSLNHGSH